MTLRLAARGPAHVADRPPEDRGLPRDHVRLMVVTGSEQTHTRFDRIADHLDPGDVVVVNRSSTRAAAWEGRRGDGGPTVVHLATHLSGRRWVVELRRPDGTGPQLDARADEVVSFGRGGRARLVGPRGGSTRLWEAAVRLPSDEGRPITYGYLATTPDLEAFQTVFGIVEGSAEMASAGRPFTPELVTQLVVRGVVVTPVTLHAGVSSPEVGERPQPEWFEVPATTARLVAQARRAGNRVVAVGTTVTRALESAVADGEVVASQGWTSRLVTPDDPPIVVDGLVTGWHEPGASHLDLLVAVAGRETVASAYAEARRRGYLWHEFGDSALFLPELAARPAEDRQ